MVTHPSAPTRQRAAGRAWALLLFFLAAVLTLATAGQNAAAAAVPTTETRVGVSAPNSITAVGLPADIAAGQHPVRAGPQQDLAQGHGVHTYYVVPSPADQGKAAPGTAVLVHNASCGPLTGYTKHGLDQAIGRDGHGVSVRAINDAVRNPIKTSPQRGEATKYVGKDATVILNKNGKVITTYARNRNGWRQ